MDVATQTSLRLIDCGRASELTRAEIMGPFFEGGPPPGNRRIWI
jgi:hypothetical protein